MLYEDIQDELEFTEEEELFEVSYEARRNLLRQDRLSKKKKKVNKKNNKNVDISEE